MRTALHLTTRCPVANARNKVPAPGASSLGPQQPWQPRAILLGRQRRDHEDCVTRGTC